MNIVIYGTGGVGGYFGARLEQSGNNVTFIARGEHLKAIQKKGLLLKSIKGNYLVTPAKVTSDISDITNIDLVLICVKSWQLKEAALKIKPILKEDTMVIPLLNGVNNEAILYSIFAKNHVLGGLSKIVSSIKDFGVIEHISYEPIIVFGELNFEKTERAIQLEHTFSSAGIKTKLSDNIQRDIWSKFVYIVTISGMGALTRKSVGAMMASEHIKMLLYKTAEEIVMVARAKGVQLPEDIIEKQFRIIDSQPYDTTSSLQRDFMAGRPSELESQNGAIVKMGEELGLPTPINSFIYDCLLPQEKKVRNLS
jgi:2-dehydropantoate 2-reductase